MTAQTIAITAIDASERLRPLDPDTVAAYAAISEQRLEEGKSPLIQPIIVRPDGDFYKLVTGGHRLAGLVEIGVQELTIGVDVIVRDQDAQAAFEDEVFENLANAGLNALDRAIFLFKAWETFHAKHGETRGRKSKIEQLQEDKKTDNLSVFSSERFTQAAAERVGMSTRYVERAKRIAQGLIKVGAVEEVRGTMLEDNQNELLQLVDIPEEHRRAAAAAIKRGEAKCVREARIAIRLDEKQVDDPQARIHAQMIDLWKRASALTRKQFMDDCDLAPAKKSEG